MGFFDKICPCCFRNGPRHSNQYDAWLARERLNQNLRLEERLDKTRKENVELRSQVVQANQILMSFQSPEELEAAMEASSMDGSLPSQSVAQPMPSLSMLPPVNTRRGSLPPAPGRRPAPDMPRSAPDAVPAEVRQHAARQARPLPISSSRPSSRELVELPPKLRKLIERMPPAEPPLPEKRRPPSFGDDLEDAENPPRRRGSGRSEIRAEVRPATPEPSRSRSPGPPPEMFTFPKANTRAVPAAEPVEYEVRSGVQPSRHYSRSTSPFARASSVDIPVAHD